MASKDDVAKLAALARLTVSESELERFAKEFDSILAYVGQINELSIPNLAESTPAVRNVMREDGVPHAAGIHTAKLVEQFPAKDGDYLVVKKIVSND